MNLTKISHDLFKMYMKEIGIFYCVGVIVAHDSIIWGNGAPAEPL